MSNEVLGVVQRVNITESAPNAARKWTKCSFLVNDAWYAAFINDDNKHMLQAIKEGDAVKVVYTVKGDFNTLTNISVVAENKVEYKEPIEKARSAQSDKEFRITYLACRRDAIQLVTEAIKLGMLTMPKKQADQLDTFYGLVEEYAARMSHASFNITMDDVAPVEIAKETKVVNE